jgi:hypothetical protein
VQYYKGKEEGARLGREGRRFRIKVGRRCKNKRGDKKKEYKVGKEECATLSGKENTVER